MPGNKLEEGICNVYELDNSSQWHLPQAVGGNWPVIDFNQWIGKPRPIGAPQNFNLKNYNLQQLGINNSHCLWYYFSIFSHWLVALMKWTHCFLIQLK